MMSKYIDRKNDEEIISIIKEILDNGKFTVDTVNESILVKLMELRGTPINYHKTVRDIEGDFKMWKNGYV